ncbi:MAG: COX15/CtaA family protein [Proteobacteria bacterium]|nr:COX15/CtaA family protein [Pseudomonadota bacterium]
MPAARWIRSLALAGLVLCFVVVVLGAYVRLTTAGLGCPDWPGCYGHITPPSRLDIAENNQVFPNKPIDEGKAWREMIHRYAASTLGLICVSLAVLAFTTRRQRLVSLPLAWGLVALIVFQGLLGMLTVTWQVTPLVVTGHLLFGLTTLSLLWWLWLSLQPNRSSGNQKAARLVWRVALIGLVALAIQIALGGWTSTNYADIACPDFPRCQNAWWPDADFRDAFVLWRGLGVNYEGGVLSIPARVAIHLTHRMGAIIAALTLTLAAVMVIRRRAALPSVAPAAYAVLIALVAQLTIGITMVLHGFPLSLATAHTAGAALLLLSVLALLRGAAATARNRSF